MYGVALALVLSIISPPEVCWADLNRFPGPSETVRQLAVADAHLDDLYFRRQTHGGGWGLDAAITEAIRYRDCWLALDGAHHYDVSSTRWWFPIDHLKWLRDEIGCNAYYRGAMPPPIPPSHWRRID
jgi:hypothetical protein